MQGLTTNQLSNERIVQSEKNAVSNAQYLCHQSLEINTVPASIVDILESSVCKALP